jgi:hypothetical protein
MEIRNKFSKIRNVVRTFMFEVPVSTALLRFYVFKAECLLYNHLL